MAAFEHPSDFPKHTKDRAAWLKEHGGLNRAIEAGLLSDPVTLPLSEALVIGLMRQGITKYLAIFGHGNTALGEILRVYEDEGLVQCWQFRNEVEMAHAGTALRWIYDEPCAVITSIGPGALQAMAGSLAAASNGVGIYHIYGDETTHGEGYNMQQIPKPAQGLFGQITSLMGQSYTLHTPGGLRDALRKGAQSVFHPWRAGPYFLNLPLNVQPENTQIRIDALPVRPDHVPVIPINDGFFDQAIELIRNSSRIAIKAGGGSRNCAAQLLSFAEKTGAAVVLAPGSTGVLPDHHQQNMHVGGSKGSISGNFAMQNADLLIVVGSRGVCQSDCSGIGWPKVQNVININADWVDSQHYNRTLALMGEAAGILDRLNELLVSENTLDNKRDWLLQCAEKKREWESFKSTRYNGDTLKDPVWNRSLMTQPQAIKVTADFCKAEHAIKLFDAGDIQANGFQIVEDDEPGETYSESGSSYMGFAVSALLSGAMADKGRYAVAFTGDGSFMMNPQILIDGVEHGVHGTIVLFDNRRMAAISNLQLAQYGEEYRTSDTIAVDYVQLASAIPGIRALFGGYTKESLAGSLAEARAHRGLSLVHVPVYHGDDPEGGMGVYGQWNVGNWCAEVQQQYARSLI